MFYTYLNNYRQSRIRNYKSLENQFIYPILKVSKLILAAPGSTAACVRFFAHPAPQNDL